MRKLLILLGVLAAAHVAFLFVRPSGAEETASGSDAVVDGAGGGDGGGEEEEPPNRPANGFQMPLDCVGGGCASWDPPGRPGLQRASTWSGRQPGWPKTG